MSGTSQQLAPESRSRRIDTRPSIAELALIEKVAEWRGLPPSAFIRGAALAAAKQAEGRSSDNDPVVLVPVVLTAQQLSVVDGARVEVKRVGVNLTELSRLGRRGVVDLGSLATVVEELAEQYERLINALGGKGSP